MDEAPALLHRDGCARIFDVPGPMDRVLGDLEAACNIERRCLQLRPRRIVAPICQLDLVQTELRGAVIRGFPKVSDAWSAPGIPSPFDFHELRAAVGCWTATRFSANFCLYVSEVL